MVAYKRIAFGFGIIVLSLLLMAVLFQNSLGLALYERGAVRAVQNDLLANLPEDGLHLALCGTGSPLPDKDRAGPCNLVIAGDQIFVVDIGEGGNRNLARMGMDPSQITAVMLTHFHSDHIDGLGPLMLYYWTRDGKTMPLPVFGPDGVGEVVKGFNLAYGQDRRYRTAHHGEYIAPANGGTAKAHHFDLPKDHQIVWKLDGLTITAFKVSHEPVSPAIGYRFDYQGRSIVISGDSARNPVLEQVAQDADLLVHDALQPELVEKMTRALDNAGRKNGAQITRDIISYHASPEDAAKSAQKAGTKQLILSHIVPPLPSQYFRSAFLGDARDYFDGKIIIGEDGMIFTLPKDSDTIIQDNLL